MDLFPTDKPSGCVISDCCNFLFSLGQIEESNPFDEFQTIEDFHNVMRDVVESFNFIGENMDLISDSMEPIEIANLIEAMNRVNAAAKEALQERKY